ncbi:hypothetical protein M378DRAFT_109928, partial [Amanita muscaria Koide BX008]
MFDDLPADVLLTILSFLCLSDISTLFSTTKYLNNFISQNSFSIYRSIAIFQFGVPSQLSYPDSLRYPPFDFHDFSPRAISTHNYGYTTWPTLCARLNQIRHSWRGTHSSAITIHRNTGDGAVHRFKVDENAGFIVSTTKHGGVVATDLDGPYGAWTRRKPRVRPFAHCEYSHGYLIFDRLGTKEVWRLTDYRYYYPSDPPVSVVPESQPDDWQHASAEQAYVAPPPPPVGVSIRPRKGHFTPHALLHPPTRTRAFRFIYPYLLVASWNSAYIYDVRSGVVVQQLNNIQDPPPNLSNEPLGDLSYVEHSPQHVFICGELSVRVFTRSSGSSGGGGGQCVLSIPAVHDNYGRHRYTIQNARDNRSRDMNWVIGKVPDTTAQGQQHQEGDWEKVGSVLYRHHLVREHDRVRKFVDQIAAAHASPCGNYLALLLETSRLLLVRDLHRIIAGQTSLYENTIEVQLGTPSRFSKYLAFEYGRVGVATRNGIFIVIPPPNFFSSQLPLDEPPAVLRVHPLNDSFVLACVSCLQITPTGLYVNWSPHCPLARLPNAGEEGEGHGDGQQHHRRNIHALQEEVFWSGLETELSVGYQDNGYAFVQEE